MNDSSFRYILRYSLDFGFEHEKRVDELVAFCLRSRIQEVMFFHNAEELFHGYDTRAERERWFELAGLVKEKLSAHHIALSINPWVTTVHEARGRKLDYAHRTLRLMRGENGQDSTITSCPLCRHWQDELCEFFAEIAVRLSPTVIWIEDDWRLHNHGEQLGYSGCFCEEHMRCFSERIGRQVSREELLAAITGSGQPHPWRKQWLDLCNETLLEPARRLYEAVHGANPQVRLGLMSSSPIQHATAGRNWHQLQQVLSPNQPLCIRPNCPPYTETFALMVPPEVPQETIACYSSEVEIYPELENSPRCGSYSKSGTFSLFEIFNTACFGSMGITINHYDMMGNGVSLDEVFGHYLSHAKPQLDALACLDLHHATVCGVDVLVPATVPYNMHCHEHVGSIRAFVNNHRLWGDTLAICGIAHRYVEDYRQVGQMVAISGQTLRCIPVSDWEHLFSHHVLLDAESVSIICESGRGDLIGISSFQWRSQEETGFAYEHIVYNDARMSAQRCADRIAVFSVHSDAEILSEICDARHTVLAAGCTRYRNDLGGTIISVPYELGTKQFFMGFFNNYRRDLLQEICRPAGCLMAKERPFFVYERLMQDKRFVALFNSTIDSCDACSFEAQGLSGRAEILQENGSWRGIDLETENGVMTLRVPFAPLQGQFLLFDRD